MIRYPELVVVGQVHGGKTEAVIEAAHNYRKATGNIAVVVNDEENETRLYERMLFGHRREKDRETMSPEDAKKLLKDAPDFCRTETLEAYLQKLNPSGEAGTQIAIFLDVPELCSLEMNTYGSGNNGKRFRMGVNINGPLGDVVKNYSVRAASIHNYIMPC